MVPGAFGAPLAWLHRLARSYARPMTDAPVELTPSGPPETILPPERGDAVAALTEALDAADARAAVAGVCSRWPRYLEAWARLGDLADEPAFAYAAYRTGYHRGLDQLRASGWRGSGFVRWAHADNQGFLRALAGLERVAAAWGERDEEERCALFLRQLDPSWPPSDLDP